MHLINCKTYELEDFLGSNIPKYAILSHTWEAAEVTHAELSNLDASRSKDGFRKIEHTCRQALIDGYEYAWVDTVCIDKTSSAELTEAINSMYKWYENAEVCYANLIDVDKEHFDEQFSKSRWFTRGWTLQELIAPKRVVFYDADWQPLGSKHSLVQTIQQITQIGINALNDFHDIHGSCVAHRMSWASQRVTTREEDMAYCLLGIFQVNMPLLYGEGDRAFQRLQQEIIRNHNDDSILAWGLKANFPDPSSLDRFCNFKEETADTPWRGSRILAKSPAEFANSRNLGSSGLPSAAFTWTNMGLQIELPLMQTPTMKEHGRWIGILSCSTPDPLKVLGIMLIEYNNMKMKRIKTVNVGTIGDETTIAVGLADAVKSSTARIQIMDSLEGYAAEPAVWNNFHRHHVVINTTRQFTSTGYSVVSTIAALPGIDCLMKVRDSDWAYSSGESATVTMTGPLRVRGYGQSVDYLVVLNFRMLRSTDVTFSILCRGPKMLICQDFSISPTEYYTSLANNSDERSDRAEATLEPNGRTWQITARMKENCVHDWKLTEIFVHAVNTTFDNQSDKSGSDSSDGPVKDIPSTEEELTHAARRPHRKDPSAVAEATFWTIEDQQAEIFAAIKAAQNR